MTKLIKILRIHKACIDVGVGTPSLMWLFPLCITLCTLPLHIIMSLATLLTFFLMTNSFTYMFTCKRSSQACSGCFAYICGKLRQLY